jgi:hypothetical protein
MDDKTTAKADRATAKTEHRHAGRHGKLADVVDQVGKRVVPRVNRPNGFIERSDDLPC